MLVAGTTEFLVSQLTLPTGIVSFVLDWSNKQKCTMFKDSLPHT